MSILAERTHGKAAAAIAVLALTSFAFTGCSGANEAAQSSASSESGDSASTQAVESSSSQSMVSSGYTAVPGVHDGDTYVATSDGSVYYKVGSDGKPIQNFSWKLEPGFTLAGDDMDISLGQMVDTDLYSFVFNSAEWSDDIVLPSGEVYGNYAPDSKWLIIKGSVTNKSPDKLNTGGNFGAKGVLTGNTYSNGNLTFISKNEDFDSNLESGKTVEAWIITQLSNDEIDSIADNVFEFDWQVTKATLTETSTGKTSDTTLKNAVYRLSF